MKSTLALLVGVLTCGIHYFLSAQPTDPILVVNTSMHTAMCNRISVDKAGAFALTVSDDKTARLWLVSDGSLVQTFRVPANSGDDGKIYAGALSPDGRIAALGGFTNLNVSGNHNIYLFDTRSGRMLNRLTGLPNVINDLEFSPDGSWLAAGLGGANGVRVWDARSWTLQHSLEGYGDNCYNVSFSPQGGMATVSFDGKLRLYNEAFSLVRTQENLSGKLPFSLAFDETGRRLALGFDDSPTLEVRDGQTLSLLYKPKIESTDESKFLEMVAFQGTQLLTGGTYSQYTADRWKRVLRCYTDFGKGSYKDLPIAGNSIMDIKPLPRGGWLFVGSQPDWGRISANGEVVFYNGPELLNYLARDLTHLRISRAGDEIGFTPTAQSPLSFSISDRSLKDESSLHPSFTDQASGFLISDWNDNYSPSCNGVKLDFLSQSEMARSVDLDGESAVLGADWNLYAFNNKSKMLWEVPVPAMAACVNISGNGKVVLVGHSGGTLRWYRMSDGEVLLSFYLHPDKKRWVLWTPSGYYDASPGAEDLIGWHLNQGPDKEALFYPASQFRRRFYRPDVIDLILQTYDETEALTQANAARGTAKPEMEIVKMLPPIATITSPASGSRTSSRTVTLRYSLITAPDAPVTQVWATVDGTRGLKPVTPQAGSDGTLTVEIPESSCTVTLFARNQHGTSQGSSIRLEWAGQKPTPNLLNKPNLYVLAIGVSDYANPNYKLNFAHKDAQDLAAALAKQKGKVFGQVETHVVTNAEANQMRIRKELSWLKKSTTQYDLAVVFFAGHGKQDANGDFYFFTHETDLDDLSATGLPNSLLINDFQNIPGKALMFMDACHSGSLAKKSFRAPDMNQVLNDFAQAQGKITFSSSTGRQLSQEDATWGNGAFTKALVEGLNGQGDQDKDGIITVKELDLYITKRVKTITNGEQSPTTVFSADVPDFPIGMKP
jgi:hypothetical protein